MSQQNLKKLVVVGYGFAGSRTTAKLAKTKKYEITVVTPLDYQENSLNMTAVIATGSEVYKDTVYNLVKEDGVSYIHASCVSIDDKKKELILSNEQTLAYDVCVIATGVNIPFYYPNPDREQTIAIRSSAIDEMFEKVKKAKSIVISGGGPIGIETAADIKLRFKDKKITLVHPAKSLLESMSPQFPPLVESKLKHIGITIIFNDRVTSYNESSNTVELKSGKTENNVDLYIPAFSTGPNTSFMPSSSLDDKGYIKVNEYFQVTAMDGVFSVSACCNISQSKTVTHFNDQMDTFVANVAASLNGSSTASLKSYKPGFMGSIKGPMIVALGHGLGAQDTYGVGPDLPGLPGFCCWCCCCLGSSACSPPEGQGVGKLKSDFNNSVKPTKGLGMDRT